MRSKPRSGIPALQVMEDSNFRTLWCVQLVVEMCRRLELLVLGLLIYQETNSPFQLGLILVFNYLPKSVLSPFCGTLADRFSRHRIIMLAQGLNIVAAAAICSLIVGGDLKPWHVYLATAVQGVSWAVQEPARRTAIFDMVGQGRLVNAVSLEQVSTTGGKLVGPLLGGVLVGLAGYGWAYGVAVAFHVVALAMLVFVTIPPLARTSVPETVFRGLAEVTGYTLRTPMLLGTLCIIVLMNALGFPVEQFVPAIGKDELGVGPMLVGLLVSALAMGQITAAAAMAFMRIDRNHGRLLMLGCLVVLVMGLMLAWSPVYALSFAVFSVSGCGQACFATMQGTMTLLWAPPHMRGRMMGLRSLCIGMGGPMGALQIGVLATILGTPWAISTSALAGMLLLLPPLLLTPLVFPGRGRQPGAAPATGEPRPAMLGEDSPNL